MGLMNEIAVKYTARTAINASDGKPMTIPFPVLYGMESGINANNPRSTRFVLANSNQQSSGVAATVVSIAMLLPSVWSNKMQNAMQAITGMNACFSCTTGVCT